MFVLGTAGHVDHGKSALVRALTGIDPDRLQEEKERGLTIDLGFAWLKLPSGREMGIIDVPGHTGSGFLVFPAASDESCVTWTFDAPAAGTYILELRYLARKGQNPAKVTLNGCDAGDIILWPTGGQRTWAWDRKTVTLTKGPNTIKIAPTAPAWIDHLNILHAGTDAGLR